MSLGLCSHGHKMAATFQASPTPEIWQCSVEQERDISSSMSLLKNKEIFPKGPYLASLASFIQCFIGHCLSYPGITRSIGFL